MNAARFANWEQDEQLAAAELGRRLADDPEAVVVRLRRSSAGCDWLIGRWTLLGNGLSTADEGGPGCTWTDADLALALDLLGLPAELRHLDDRPGRLESLRAEARSGSDEAVAELREIVAEEVAELEERDEEAWDGIEQPRLQDWRSGVEIDLGPEGTRLRRYEAAADRLFRSAWTKLERLRKERGQPLIPRRERMAAPEPAPRPPAPPPPARGSPGAGRGAGAPAARGLEVVAAGRSGGAGARLLGRRPAPAGDAPRTRRTRRRAGRRTEDEPPGLETSCSEPPATGSRAVSPGVPEVPLGRALIRRCATFSRREKGGRRPGKGSLRQALRRRKQPRALARPACHAGPPLSTLSRSSRADGGTIHQVDHRGTERRPPRAAMRIPFTAQPRSGSVRWPAKTKRQGKRQGQAEGPAKRDAQPRAG